MQYGGKIVNPAPGIAAKSLMKAGELAKAAEQEEETCRAKL
jgi:hypothetical protein